MFEQELVIERGDDQSGSLNHAARYASAAVAHALHTQDAFIRWIERPA